MVPTEYFKFRFQDDFKAAFPESSNEPIVVRANTHIKGRKPKERIAEAQNNIEKSKGGRPKGSKDTSPRKPRSDKGKIRGPHKNKAEASDSNG